MLTDNDTVRSDWLIIIAGLLAGGWFFFDYGNHHPLSYADASFGRQATLSQANDLLDGLGYSLDGANYRSAFYTRGDLLDNLQQNADFHRVFSDSIFAKAFSPYYWNLDLFLPGDVADAGGNIFQQRRLEGSISKSVRFNQEGEWLEFRNPNNRRPHRLLSADALDKALQLPQQLLLDARDDSVVLANFSFEFDRELTDEELIREDGSVEIGLDQARRIAATYLDQTGWPLDHLHFDRGNVVPFDDFEAAELNYLYADVGGGQQLYLRLLLSPAGSLLGMEAEYTGIDVEEPAYLFAVTTIRVLFILIFVFWLIILLFIRVRLRVIDIKPAILLAVLAGLAIPAFMVLEWVYEQTFIPDPPGIIDLVILLFSVGLSATLISILFFAVTVIGESVTRQNWIEKIRTIDLIRIGHLFNRPVGRVFIHAVPFGLMLAALWSVLLWILPDAYISVDRNFLSDTTYLAPMVGILSLFFFCFLAVHAVFMVLLGLISSRSKNPILMAAVTTTVFALLVPVFYVQSGPLVEEMLLNGAAGLGLGLIYLYRDVLTTLFSFFIFTLLISTADGWLMVQSPDALIFYLSTGLAVLFLAFGYVAVTRGRSVKELPKFVPDYIEDLAQEERVKQELQIARKVQQSFLPVRYPELEKLELAAICIPAYETGGDYYDFIELNDDQVAITIGDVSGKGFQAAFHMTFIKGVLHALCREYDSAVTILKKANRLFLENVRKGTFISLTFGVIDFRSLKFTFSRAGHNPLLYYNSRENRMQTIRPDGIALGLAGDKIFEENISEATIELEDGDMLILFTDGIVEATNRRGQFYGHHRLKRMVFFHHLQSAREILDFVLRDIEKFSGGEYQHDDMTLVVIKSR